MSAKRSWPNPFYVSLLLVSTAFVATCLGYLVAPTVVDNALRPRPGGNVPGPAALAMADWFERRGTTALTIEIVVMIVLGVVAMLSDRWFADKTEHTP